MKTRVLDSWPVLEWISARRPALEIVDRIFEEAEKGTARLFMSAINVGEVYYFLRKHGGVDLAEKWRENSQTLPVTIEVPSIQDIWIAAELKGQFPIAYADAFSAALAFKHRCLLITGDPEFRSIPGLDLDWIDRTEN